MGVVAEINTYLIHTKVPGYTFGEKGEKSPFMIQCGTITAPEPSYKPVWNENTDKFDIEEHPPLNKPEFLRWPVTGNWPGQPGHPVFIKSRNEAQAMIDSGDAKKIRDAYYASLEEAERKLKQRAQEQAVKVSGGAMAEMLKAVVQGATEEKRGPGRPPKDTVATGA